MFGFRLIGNSGKKFKYEPIIYVKFQAYEVLISRPTEVDKDLNGLLQSAQSALGAENVNSLSDTNVENAARELRAILQVCTNLFIFQHSVRIFPHFPIISGNLQAFSNNFPFFSICNHLLARIFQLRNIVQALFRNFSTNCKHSPAIWKQFSATFNGFPTLYNNFQLSATHFTIISTKFPANCQHFPVIW